MPVPAGLCPLKIGDWLLISLQFYLTGVFPALINPCHLHTFYDRVQMPAPKNIIAKSISTPNLLAFIFTQKFCEHNPYYRQSKAFERRLIDISRADIVLPKVNLDFFRKAYKVV